MPTSARSGRPPTSLHRTRNTTRVPFHPEGAGIDHEAFGSLQIGAWRPVGEELVVALGRLALEQLDADAEGLWPKSAMELSGHGDGDAEVLAFVDHLDATQVGQRRRLLGVAAGVIEPHRRRGRACPPSAVAAPLRRSHCLHRRCWSTSTATDRPRPCRSRREPTAGLADVVFGPAPSPPLPPAHPASALAPASAQATRKGPGRGRAPSRCGDAQGSCSCRCARWSCERRPRGSPSRNRRGSAGRRCRCPGWAAAYRVVRSLQVTVIE